LANYSPDKFGGIGGGTQIDFGPTQQPQPTNKTTQQPQPTNETTQQYYSPDELGGIAGAEIDFGTNDATTIANQLPKVFDDVTTGELLHCVVDLFGEHQATILPSDNYSYDDDTKMPAKQK
jgi:hypothetical protein